MDFCLTLWKPCINETINAKNFNDITVCESCSCVYKKKTLNTHAQLWPGRKVDYKIRRKLDTLTQSPTFLATVRCQNDFVLKSRLKDGVFLIMRPDEINAITLICLFGETHVKNHKKTQIVTVISNKMQ